MNKNEILEKYKKEAHIEFDTFINERTNRYILISIFVISLLVLLFSFYSSYHQDILMTTLCFLSCYCMTYEFSLFIYKKNNKYLILCLICFIIFLFSLVQVWLIMW